tara:strand:- start:244 stop:516 length:273 start_codon:yes stop_codon:yes gene_type:complete
MNQRVIDNAIAYLGADVVIKPSTRQSKKFMVLNPETKKYIHFGQKNASDFTIHQDKDRQKAYLARATAIKGDWSKNKYSPNNLSINILWK